MNHNWGYVTAGYLVSAGALGSYVVWLKLRIRRLRRTSQDDGRG